MQMASLKTSFLGLVFVAIASSSELLIACTNSQNQSQAPNTTETDTGSMQGMDHSSSMDHSMAMNLGPADANYDLRFIDAMSLHHQGAVKMAQEAEQKAQHPEIKQLAGEIIDAQNKEIGQLTQWRKAWYPQASNESVTYGGDGQPKVAMTEKQQQGMMMSKDLGPADPKFDLHFMDAMIPHHEGALAMAQDALSKSERPEVKQLAQAILTSQQTEIEQMKQWRQTWYKQ
jgi:uncharacterized protein (DUF305 family)